MDGQALYHRTPLRSIYIPQHGCQAVGRLVLLAATNFGLRRANTNARHRCTKELRTWEKSTYSLPKNSAASALRCAPELRPYSSSTTAAPQGCRSSCGTWPWTRRRSPARRRRLPSQADSSSDAHADVSVASVRRAAVTCPHRSCSPHHFALGQAMTWEPTAGPQASRLAMWQEQSTAVRPATQQGDTHVEQQGEPSLSD